MAEPVMENPLQKSRESTMQILITKTVSEIKDCVIEMKKGWEDTSGYPITDDSQTLQRFFAKLELLLQTGLKQKNSLLGGKKGYWNYFSDQLADNKSINDGIRFVKSLKELKSNVGRGRAFLRYLMVHHRLADTLQHCFMNSNIIREWYQPRSFFHQKKVSDDLLSVLYDLNEIQFDLAPTGYDLDAAWPTFARKGGMSGPWRVPSRSNSILSLTSMPQMDSLQNISSSLPPEIDECGSMVSELVEDSDMMEELNCRNKELEAENKELLLRCASLDYKCKDLSARCTELTEREASLLAVISDLESRVSSAESTTAATELTETATECSTAVQQNTADEPATAGQQDAIAAAAELTIEQQQTAELATQQEISAESSTDIQQETAAKSPAVELTAAISVAAAGAESGAASDEDEAFMTARDSYMLDESTLDTTESTINITDSLTLDTSESTVHPTESPIDTVDRSVVSQEVEFISSQSSSDTILPINDSESVVKKDLQNNKTDDSVQHDTHIASNSSSQNSAADDISSQNNVPESDRKAEVSGSSVVPDILPSRTIAQKPDITNISGGVDINYLSNDVLVSKVEALQKQLDEMSLKREELREELLQVKGDYACVNNTLADLRTEVENLQEENSKLSLNKDLLNQELDDTKGELNTLRFLGKEDGFFEKAYQEVLKDKSEIETKLKNFEDYRKSAAELYDEKVRQQDKIISELKEKLSQYGANNVSEKSEDQNCTNESNSQDFQVVSEQLQSSFEGQKEVDRNVLELSSQLENVQQELESLKVKLTESESLVKDLESRNSALKEATKRTIIENESLKRECSDLKVCRAELECKVDAITEMSETQSERLMEVECMLEARERELNVVRVELDSVKEERDKITGNLKDDLDMMTGSVQRREKMWDNVRDSMEKEIRTLRFDLNAKISSQKAKIRELEMLVVDEATKPKLAEQKSMIDLLQLTVENLRKEQELEQERAREQLDDLKQCLGTAETENFNIRQQLEQRDKEMEAEREKWRQESETYKSDIKELKAKLVQLVRDKDNLWKKKHKLSNERKVRRSFHWVDSNEVTHCLGCNSEFGLTMRKHHCRECGKVYCWNCCNNWILTSHSGSKERVCNSCIQDLSNLERASSDSEHDTLEDELEERRRLSMQRSTSGSESSSISTRDSSDPRLENNLSADVSENNYPTDLNPFNETTGTLRDTQPDTQADKQTGSSLSQQQTTAESTAEPSTSAASGDGSQADSWRVTSQAKAAVTWLTSTTSLLAANVLPGTVRRPASAEDTSKLKKEPVNDVNSEKSFSSKRSRSNSGDAFDVFSSEEFSESLLYPPPDPKVICTTLVKLEDFDTNDTIEGPSDLFVKAGRSCAVPVFIDQINATLIWQFSTQPKGIVFSITYNESASSSSDTSEEVIAPCRVNSHLKPAEGELQAKRVGVYTLFFDNNQSRFTGKKITYKLQAKRPASIDISTLAAETTVVS